MITIHKGRLSFNKSINIMNYFVAPMSWPWHFAMVHGL